MYKTILAFTMCLSLNYAFTQSGNSLTPIKTIVVPDFAQPHVKAFYIEYSNHLLKCIKAIREKDEAKVIKLFKSPGEALVKQSRIIEKQVIINSVEKQKWMQYAAQVYPYIKELEASAYYQKLYGKE